MIYKTVGDKLIVAEMCDENFAFVGVISNKEMNDIKTIGDKLTVYDIS